MKSFRKIIFIPNIGCDTASARERLSPINQEPETTTQTTSSTGILKTNNLKFSKNFKNCHTIPLIGPYGPGDDVTNLPVTICEPAGYDVIPGGHYWNRRPTNTGTNRQLSGSDRK